MHREALIKAQKFIFQAMVLCLPLMVVHIRAFTDPAQILYPIMNRAFLDKPTAFFLPLALLLAAFTELKYGNFFIKKKYFLGFGLISITVFSIADAVALYNFPTDGLIIFQHMLIFYLIELAKIVGIYLDAEQMRIFSYWCDMAYNSCTYFIWAYGGAYWLYCLYFNHFRELVNTVVRLSLACFLAISLYSLVELAWFLGSATAEYILTITTPYLHRVNDGYGWWPPLLWGGVHRMRTIFAEPSYMGIYFAFSMPFIWYAYFKKGCITAKEQDFRSEGLQRANCFSQAGFGNVGNLLLLACFWGFFMMFLTRSRTAYGISLLQLALYALCIYWKGYREYYKQAKRLCLCCLLAAVLANVVVGINISGIQNLDNGSNNSRLGYTIATLKIGLDKPLMGAGSELFNYYVKENAPEFTYDNKEFNTWIDTFEAYGLSGAYPQICEYSTLFAKYGIFGPLLFLIPLLLAFKRVGKILYKGENKDLTVPIIGVSLFGMALTGISNNIDISYCYWVVLGMAYACADYKTKSELESKIND